MEFEKGWAVKSNELKPTGEWLGADDDVASSSRGFLRIQKPNITTHITSSILRLHKTIYKHTRTAKQTSIKQECINTYNNTNGGRDVPYVRSYSMCSLLENANMLTQC